MLPKIGQTGMPPQFIDSIIEEDEIVMTKDQRETSEGP
jgi:hypothetical protein